jgi:hypothetical protein
MWEGYRTSIPLPTSVPWKELGVIAGRKIKHGYSDGIIYKKRNQFRWKSLKKYVTPKLSG